MTKSTAKLKEILVVGNGFDVAQGLPTQYIDFVEFLKINDPVKVIEGILNGDKIKDD